MVDGVPHTPEMGSEDPPGPFPSVRGASRTPTGPNFIRQKSRHQNKYTKSRSYRRAKTMVRK